MIRDLFIIGMLAVCVFFLIPIVVGLSKRLVTLFSGIWNRVDTQVETTKEEEVPKEEIIIDPIDKTKE